MKRPILLMASLAAASAALATTYVRVEKDGTKTYSDRPIPGGHPVELEAAQTYSAPPSASAPPDSTLPAEQRLLQQIDDFTYSTCAISPENDSTFTNPTNVPVTVNVSPEVRVGDLLQLSIDGKPAAPGVRSMTLDPAYRGTHVVQVTIKDQFGRMLCSSSISFHVMRPSVNMPARR
jgi:uncharacterized protein DUF4124